VFFRQLLFGLCIFGIFYYFIGRHVYSRVSAEISYRQQYGADWKEHYSAARHVSVEEDHKKLLVAGGALVTVTVLCYLIYRQVVPRRAGRKRYRRRRTQPLPG
jgi:hypothetical protein